ncbi:MAG: hypothetical protein ABI882_20135 [Acidobacteriota bacterium]
MDSLTAEEVRPVNAYWRAANCLSAGQINAPDLLSGALRIALAATESVNRDMYLLTSENQGRSFSGVLLDKWKLNACPMSSGALTDVADSAHGLLAAWETQGQVYFASFDPKKPHSLVPIPATGVTGKRKHPALAANPRGETLFVWTEGTNGKKGGSFAWPLFDPSGKPVGEKSEAPGIPVGASPLLSRKRMAASNIVPYGTPSDLHYPQHR